MELMALEKSRDEIKKTLGINKKTIFDWRHKVLSGLEESGKERFTGITDKNKKMNYG